MSLENEDQSSPDKATETRRGTDKARGSRVSYSREFILSLSTLEICKKLPSGFDQSILSELEDTSHSIHDWPRTHSSLPLQSFSHTEYGSAPPTRGDSGNYSRGSYGRWDSRSSGRSDRDSDSQTDRESDSGKRFGSQSRKSWQGTEHDGLLGSGSFPRPPGSAAGVSAPKARSNDQYQLNRSNEPYYPPRPYKAAPLSRDSYNDETFGSTECTSEDRVEEERRRRASFELMRKEQQKALQEKQKPNLEKLKADSVSDISVLLDDTKEEKCVLDRNDGLDSTTNPSISSTDFGKSALPSQAPYRPLVPPGFKNTVPENTSGVKSLVQSPSIEAGKLEIEENILHSSFQNGTLSSVERKSSEEVILSNKPPEDKSMHVPLANKGEQIANSSSLHSDVSSKKICMEEFLNQTSILLEAHEAQNESEMIKLNSKVSGPKIGDELNQNDATSILEKIFGNAPTTNASNSMDSVEHHDNKPDDSCSQKTVHSSKFARWFVEEERKTEDDHSLSRPNDLLSLIVGSDKGRYQVDMKTLQHFPSEFPNQKTEIPNKSATNGISESLSNCNKQEVIPTILTCEDLEQTILSEYCEKSLNPQPPLEDTSVSGAKLERPIDNHASQHLLSLLQKGSDPKNTTPKILVDTDHSEIPPASDVYNVGAAPHKTGEEVGNKIHTSGEAHTLETLFGTAFMKELQSFEAPVSIQRGSVGSAQAEMLEPQGLSFPVRDNGLFSSTIDQIEVEKITNEKKILASNLKQQVKVDKKEKWLGYDDPQSELNLSKDQSEVVSKHGGFGGSVEYHLLEEESLIAVNDDLNAQFSRLMPCRSSSKKESAASTAAGDIAEKLAAIGAAIADEKSTTGSDGPPFLRGAYNQMEHEIAYRDLHAQALSPHFHSLQMSHGRPMLHPLDSHPARMNSQMKFIGRESMIQHDAPANQKFPANMLRPPFRQPNMGVTGFDLPAHHPMLQQMQMQGSFSPHLVNDFPRGAPAPHHGNQATSFMQEINPMPGYPFGPHQPNIGGPGMPLSAPDINGGSNHPEAFQRLIEMELRAKSKQIPPFAVGHSQTMYGHELDMDFRYR